jgi:YHS domain-containing protein
MRHESVAIGYEAALHAYEIGFIGIGYQVGSGIGSYSTAIGYQAGRTLGEDYAVALGYQAGYNGAGESVIWIGQGAGHSSTGSAKSIGIGKNAGKSSSGAECIYIGESAGLSNSSSNLLFIGNGSPAANDTLIKGDMDAKRIAIGVADVTLDDTLFVGVNSANDEGIVVKAAVSQVSNLTSWKNSSDSVLASVSKDGVVSAHEIVATGNGIQIASLVPASTTNKLYNSAGSLYFNGSQISAPSGVPSGIAFFGLDKAIAQDSNIVYDSGNQRINLGSGGLKFSDGTIQITADNDTYVSGIAVYSSGQAISNQSNITTNASNISTNTGNISSNTAKVNYASGQAIENESDIAALLTASGTATSLISSSGIANYASGQAVSNQANITTNAGNITYVSGVATNKFTVTAADSSNYTIDGMGLNSATDPSIYLHKGHTYYFDKQTSSHPFRVSTSNGGSAYQDADGNNIEISGQGVLKFEVPQDAPDKLYYYCTSHAAMNGVIYTTNNVDEIIHVSGIAAYASGQAITNQSNITALNTASGIATSLLAVSGTATSLVATSGIATYASGQAVSNQSNITALLTASGTATSLIASSGIASYASGQAIANESDIFAVSGIAAYASGTSGAGGSITVKEADGSPNVGNVTTIVVSNGTLTDNGGGQVTVTTGGGGGGGDVSTAQLNYVSGIAVYSSGQAISNQSNITALSTASGIATSLLAVSGTATSLVATSGIATYASGNTANISFGSNAEGDLLYHNGTSFIRLPKGTDDYILKMNGNVPNWEADTGGSSLSAGSGVFVDGASKINVYGGSGNFQELQVTSDNVFVPKVVFTGSGAVDTPITLETRSSYESVSGSGSALLFQGTQGQLFSITDNLSSGVIFSVADIAGLPLIEADASGDVKLGEFGRYVGVGSGIPEYGIDISASGRIQKGVVLSSYVPAVTTNTLYNEGGTLKFNGSSIGGGGVDTYTSGVATYASGQAISNQSSITALLSASGTATSLIASSGIASYASGQAISNQGNITALLSASGTATSLIASSGIATYASGQAVANESDLVGVSGIAAYASGVSLIVKEADGSPNVSNVRTIVVTNGTLTDDGGGQVTIATSGGGGGSSLTAGSGITIDGADKINVYGGSGHFINLAVDGAFSATTKSFLIDHPTKDGMKLQYGSLEGPENGVYVRGTSGSNIITLPEYWSTLVDQSTVTVSLTPVGYYQALYVEEKGKNYIKVGGAKGSYDYVIYGERKDVEKLKVEW